MNYELLFSRNCSNVMTCKLLQLMPKAGKLIQK